MARRDSRVERAQLEARVDELRGRLRQLEAELGVRAPEWARGGYPRGTGRLQALHVAAGIGLRAAERQLQQLEAPAEDQLAAV